MDFSRFQGLYAAIVSSPTRSRIQRGQLASCDYARLFYYFSLPYYYVNWTRDSNLWVLWSLFHVSRSNQFSEGLRVAQQKKIIFGTRETPFHVNSGPSRNYYCCGSSINICKWRTFRKVFCQAKYGLIANHVVNDVSFETRVVPERVPGEGAEAEHTCKHKTHFSGYVRNNSIMVLIVFVFFNSCLRLYVST